MFYFSGLGHTFHKLLHYIFSYPLVILTVIDMKKIFSMVSSKMVLLLFYVTYNMHLQYLALFFLSSQLFAVLYVLSLQSPALNFQFFLTDKIEFIHTILVIYNVLVQVEFGSSKAEIVIQCYTICVPLSLYLHLTISPLTPYKLANNF